MTKWGIGVAAAALATPFVVGQAEAQTNWYASGGFTISDLDSADTVIRNQFGPNSPLRASLDADEGYGAHAAIGVDGGMVRFEGELGYTWNDLEKYQTSTPTNQTLPANGRVRIASTMLNAIADFDVSMPFAPYIGAGIGYANIDIEANGPLPTAPTGPQVTLIDDDETDLAWQAMAGLSVPLGDRFALTAQYRYFNGGEVEGTGIAGRAYRSDITSSNLEFGARVKF